MDVNSELDHFYIQVGIMNQYAKKEKWQISVEGVAKVAERYKSQWTRIYGGGEANIAKEVEPGNNEMYAKAKLKEKTYDGE